MSRNDNNNNNNNNNNNHNNDRVVFEYSPSKAPTASTSIIANQPAVLFCCGFRSSMYGIKASALQEYCRSHNIAYCRFDYSGHGESCGGGGLFGDYVLSDWIQDTEFILNTVLASHNKVIIVGSSMGAWIALHLAILHPKRVGGLVGVAAAIDYFQDVFMSATPEQRIQWRLNETVYLPSQYDTDDHPISWNLIQDAQENWLLLEDDTNATTHNRKKIPIHCPVRLIHGQLDLDVPWQKSVRLMEMLTTDEGVLTLIKSGDHRLSQPQDLMRMLDAVSDLIPCCVPNKDLARQF
jgi:pimeloyl-ACP methyl ester carboxylesterase